MARTVPRQGQDPWTVVLHPDRLDQPLKWKKPRRIFVNSLSDLFHENVPFDFVCDVFRWSVWLHDDFAGVGAG
jgi:protein gp37